MSKTLILLINSCLILRLLITPAYSTEIELPDMGASSSISLTPHMEEQIGREIARKIRTSHQLIDDLEINAYIQGLGYNLVANSDDAYQNFHFFLIDSEQINAFATPGGIIAIYSGLFLTTQNESELASVVAHEIAHVTQRHLARSLEKTNQLSIPLMVGLLAGLLLGASSGGGDVGMAATVGLTAATQQAQINYTRTNEKEADNLGMKYLSLAGYDPMGMPNFFHRLERKNRYAGKKYPEFLRTHPITINRIAESTERALQYQKQAKPKQDSTNYRLMKAKLMVLNSEDLTSTKHFFYDKWQKNKQATNLEFQYGYALTLLKLREYDKAIEVLKQLNKLKPQNTSFTLALAKAYIANDQKRQVNQGMGLLAEALKNKPENLALTAEYAYTLIQEQDLEKGIHVLNSYIKNYLKHPVLYKLLALAHGKEKQLVKAHLAQAEYFYHMGQLKQAIEQLKYAKKKTSPKDFYTLSFIDARTQYIKDEQKRYKLNKK